MTLGKWIFNGLYEIISPVRQDSTEKDIEEIFCMFCKDNPTEVSILEQNLEDFDEDEVRGLAI